MKTYISILRGINVSGQKKILMTDLKALYESLRFKDVVTYIQSGNVIFKTDKELSDITAAKLIEDRIVKKYHFQVPVIIRTLDQLENLVAQNPFKNDKKIDIDKTYVTFLENYPESEKLEKIQMLDFSPDKFVIVNKEIHLYCTSYGTTKLSNNFFEQKLKVKATTRNWKTVQKLIELAK